MSLDRHAKFFWLLLFSILLSIRLGVAADRSQRVIVTGDVHGDQERLILMLRQSDLIDMAGNWIGGSSIFVQVGDFLDRGRQVREVMDMLMRLQKEASRQGGDVVVLFGNHEMMNIVRDLRYVTPGAYEAFVDKDSEKRRRSAYKKEREHRERIAKRRNLVVEVSEAEQESAWMEEHPLGYVEYSEALGPKGKYGRWLRQLPAVTKIDDSVLIHGGIHPSLSDLSLKDINRRIRDEIKAYDRYHDYLVSHRVFLPFHSMDEKVKAVRDYLEEVTGGPVEESKKYLDSPIPDEPKRQLVQVLILFLDMGGWLSMHPDGPLWYRGYSSLTDQEGIPQLSQILEAYGAKRFIIGHTIRSEGSVLRLLGGRLFLVDTLKPSALEIHGDRFYAVYLDGKEPFPTLEESAVAAGSRTAGSRLQ